MSYMELLDVVGDIRNKQEVLLAIAKCAGVNESDVDVEKINERAMDSSNIRYFKNYMTTELRSTEKRKAENMMVDTGYQSKFNSEDNVYILLSKGRNNWVGGIVGTESYLKEKSLSNKDSSGIFKKKYSDAFKNEPEKIETSTKSAKTTCETLIECLPDEFKQNKDIASFAVKYINLMCDRAMDMLEDGMSEYYVMDADMTMIVNIGLLNKRKFPIHMLLKVNDTVCTPVEIIRNEAEYKVRISKLGSDGVLVKPIPIYKSIRDSVMNLCEYECDFDFESGFEHIVNDRRDRLPDKIADLPDYLIHHYIKESFQIALKLQATDYEYSLAIYPIRTKGVSYVFPLITDFDSGMKHECYVIISKNKEGIWSPKTILTREQYLYNRSVYRPYSL